MTLDEVIAKAEAGLYHNRPTGPPRFSEFYEDMAKATGPRETAFFVKKVAKGRECLVRSLQKLKNEATGVKP